MEVFQFVGQELPVINKFCERTENSWFSKFQQAWRDSVSTGGFINFDTRKYPLDVGIPNRMCALGTRLPYSAYWQRGSIRLLGTDRDRLESHTLIQPVPGSQIVGRRKRKRHARSWRGRKKEKGKTKGVSSSFIFVVALSQFRGPDYLGAWNRLAILLETQQSAIKISRHRKRGRNGKPNKIQEK